MSDASSSPSTLRIFISSPGDVSEEREKARQVLAQLQTFYGEQVLVVPVLWEDLPLELDQPFQNGIDVILKTHPIDIAVFILWSRLGSPLGKAVRDREGNPYRSGTEREFDLMLAALEQSGGKRPDILFYRRDDEAGFNRNLADPKNSGKLGELVQQRDLAQSFVQEHFQDEEGHNTRAYHRFRQPVEFASRLKVHLRGLIDQRIDAGETQRAARWTEAPYRGLEVFDLRHADIFFGREAEVCELENRLRQRESEGCAFAAVIGASGSGKSSLTRAGLQASLTRFNLDQNVKEWRSAVLLPAQTEGNPLLGLIHVLPDLTKSGLSATEIAEAFAESPSTTVKTVLKPIFSPTTNNQQPITKLLVIIDQFEELFTDPRIASAERDRFLLALEALARSGFCWVVITMRSDFYPVAQKNEIFLRLKGENGHFDLLAPGPEALRRIITEPARMAGLRFEKRDPGLGGQSLVGKILEDAKSQADLLPLLSDLLLELYQLRSPENIITFAAYESLGDKERTGLEGALSKRADKEFGKLTPQQQATCPEILHALVTVEADADVRRRANLAALRDTPQKAGLVDAFIAARLLTADGPTVSLAHEALLRKWDRVADWVRDNRAFLRIRSRVEQALKRWSDAGNRPDLLLPEGLDLEEASALLKDAPLLLAGSEYEPVRSYIAASQDYHETRRRRIEATRRTVTFFLVLLTLGASAGAIFGYLQAKAAGKQRDTAFYNDGQGALLRAQVAKADGNRFPDQFFHLGRAIGFSGFGRAEEAGPANVLDQARTLLGIGGATDPYPVLITEQRDKALHDRIRADIAGLPSYLPVWTSGPVTGAAVTGADFSPDGRFMVAGFADGSVRRWDFSTPEMNAAVLQTAGRGAVATVSFRPDGKECAVAGPSGVTLWKEAGSETLLSGTTTTFAWAQDGMAWAAGGADGKLTVFRAGAVQVLPVAEPSSQATSLAFSPDGRTLGAGWKDGTLKLLDALTGQERAVLIAKDEAAVASIAFHPAGAWLAAANSEGWVRFWSVDGTEISHSQTSAWAMDPDAKIKVPGAGLAFSPNGRRLAIGTNDGKGGFAKLWGVEDPSAPREQATLAHHAPTSPVVAFAPDGANLITATADGTLVLWDVRALPWLESAGSLDLAVYVRDGLYRFESQEPIIGSAPSGFCNLRPDSLPGLWRAGGDAGALFTRLVQAENLAAATVLLEQLPAGDAGREDLATALLASAEEAAKRYQWNLAGARLTQVGTLGDLPPVVTNKVTALAARRPGQEGQSFANGLEKMEMIWCPKGRFLMGEDDERHEVTLTRGFWIAKHEATHAQWQAVMGNQPWNFAESGPDAPVENVSWEDAMTFCRKLTERERAAGALPDGWEYSLPTEAQWEYACRAGTNTVYSFGDEEARLGDYAWYDENSELETHPVGLKKPNAWGLHDMHGNVREWCFDGEREYQAVAIKDPLGPTEEGVDRVYRGGGWYGNASNCRAAFRYGVVPSDRFNFLGFRPACVPSR